MVVWKSTPNGKSEPVSRRNNAFLGKLNGSELTFVSCQVWSSGGGEDLLQREALHYKAYGFQSQLKLLDNSFFFVFFLWYKGHIAAYSAHLAMQFVIRDVHSGFDSRAHPCTVTLSGEVEQGRVNDAAKVGHNTDLVVAPLFLSLIFLS